MAAFHATWHPFTLCFRDRALEARYRTYELAVNTPRTRTGLLIGLAVLLVYILRDHWLADSHPVDSYLRMFIALPAVLLGIVVTHWPGPRMHLAIAAMLAVMLGTYPVAVHLGGPDYTIASTFSYLQAVLFLNVLVFVPFRYACPVAATAGVFMLGSLGVHGTDGALSKQLMTIVFVVTALSSYVTWSRELQQRRLYTRRREIERLNAERMNAQAMQIDWLRNLPVQISTDMQNRLFAIEADVERARDESGHDNDRLDRVLRRINILMDTLATTRFARDLQDRELALVDIDFGELITDVVTTRSRDGVDSCVIDLNVEADVAIRGDRVLLTNAVNQLLNAATSDLRRNRIVAFAMRRDSDRVVFELRLDSPLPGERALSDNELRTGLGIFVAGKVLELHGGALVTVSRGGHSWLSGSLPVARGGKDSRPMREEHARQ
jgi:hypothetical protein